MALTVYPDTPDPVYEIDTINDEMRDFVTHYKRWWKHRPHDKELSKLEEYQKDSKINPFTPHQPRSKIHTDYLFQAIYGSGMKSTIFAERHMYTQCMKNYKQQYPDDIVPGFNQTGICRDLLSLAKYHVMSATLVVYDKRPTKKCYDYYQKLYNAVRFHATPRETFKFSDSLFQCAGISSHPSLAQYRGSNAILPVGFEWPEHLATPDYNADKEGLYPQDD